MHYTAVAAAAATGCIGFGVPAVARELTAARENVEPARLLPC